MAPWNSPASPRLSNGSGARRARCLTGQHPGPVSDAQPWPLGQGLRVKKLANPDSSATDLTAARPFHVGEDPDWLVAQVVEHPLTTDLEVVGLDEGIGADDRRWRDAGGHGGGDSDRCYGYQSIGQTFPICLDRITTRPAATSAYSPPAWRTFRPAVIAWPRNTQR